ncbi:hypothetical protein H6P81_021705 [Aristolochia fimbriata]|uniref:Uncharacterized protein n=1 Tax=Aristolochia fimbriata TaxID=158543 RepID=A0AAV7DP75_ARIFI|nr:hypothetical protein H6P81_021705 [Aristolochia fimbriata]
MAFSSSALQRGEKAQVAPATLLPNFEFLIFPLSAGPFGAPLPILTCCARPMAPLLLRHAGGASASRTAAASRVVPRWTSREWCFRPYEPSSRRAVFPSLPRTSSGLVGSLAFPWRGAIGVSVYFPLRLSLRPGVLGAPGTPQCSWTHVNAAVRWTWLDYKRV